MGPFLSSKTGNEGSNNLTGNSYTGHELWKLDVFTGVFSFADIEPLTLYPNPVSDKLVAKNKTRFGEIIQVEIFDAMGRIVLAKEIIPTGGEFWAEFDVAGFPSGVYSFVLINEKGVVTGKKFIKH